MESDVAVNKVLRDLKATGLIDPNYSGEVRPFLEQLWVAGWEKRGKDLVAHNKKKVAQYNNEGRLLNTFESVMSAVKITGHGKDAIYNSIWHEKTTRKGYRWAYVNEKAEFHSSPF